MDTKNQWLERLTQTYLNTQPNTDIAQPDLAIFFLASSGSGKSTVRRAIVEKLNATYVCNDEVRDLLAKHPEAIAAGVQLKEIVDAAVHRLRHEMLNHFIVFDSNLSAYYMHADSYLSSTKRAGIPVYIIGIDLPKSTLVERIKSRQRHDTAAILDELDDQLHNQALAFEDVVPDFIVTKDSGIDALLDSIATAVDKKVR